MIFLALLLAWVASPSFAVTIVHSNDVLGEIEPCGCRTNPLGGYARKANLLKGLSDRQIVQVDSGDLLFPSNSMPEMLRKQSELQAEWTVRILDLLHYDAVTPGEKDFALGVKTFKKVIGKGKTHFIAANLDYDGKPLLPPSVILRRKNADGKPVRVAILGLVGTGTDLEWPKGMKASDPIAAAKKRVPELRKEADFVIALTHEGEDADKLLAKSVPGIDMIIGGHSQSFIQHPEKIGKTVIYQSSFRNQYVGLIDLATFPTDDSYKLIGLDAAYDSPSEMPGAVDQAVSQFKDAIAKLNTTEDLAESKSKGPSHYQTFPRCAECHLKQFDFWRTTAHATALAPLVKAKQDKNKECLQCHTVGLGAPGGFNNVNELATIQKGDEPAESIPNERFADYLASLHDGKNLNAPARGLSSNGSKNSSQDSPQNGVMTLNQSLGHLKQAWTPVQCENCHGAGAEHPMAGQLKKSVDTQVCLTCHTSDRAPEWYKADGKPDWDKIKAKHAQVSCPAGDMSGE